ncbi:MAG TPA: nitroreductase family protein, partial [Nocardioidaceae bacterium]|nr:nitroreductase family protein [Nocardioidaceae bacterium]
MPQHLYDVINRRRDVRAEFTGEPVPSEQLMRVLSAAHAAPSVGHSQPWDFVLVDDVPTRTAFQQHVFGRHAIKDAGLYSACLAIQNLWLAATAEGLGVRWVSFYREEFLQDLLGIPPEVRPIAWLCLGSVSALQEVPDLERFGWR